MRARARTTHREDWQRVLAALPALAGDPPAPPGPQARRSQNDVAHAIAGVSLAWAVERRPDLLAPAKKWTLAAIDYEPWGYTYNKPNVDLAAGHLLYAIGWAYDLLWPELTVDERNRIRASLERHSRLVYEYFTPSAMRSRFEFTQNHNFIPTAGLGVAALALLGESPEAERWAAAAYAHHHRANQLLSPDGYYYEGIEYVSLQAAPMTRLPLQHRFEDSGVVFSRTSWEKDALAFAFKAGPPEGHRAARLLARVPEWRASTGHAHPDAGSFIVWAKGRMLVGDTGYAGQPQARHHNTVVVGGFGQGLEKQHDAWEGIDRGALDRVRIEDVSLGSSSLRIVAEIVAAYPPAAGLKLFRREFSFEGPGSFRVRDRLETTEDRALEWYLHASSVRHGRFELPERRGRRRPSRPGRPTRGRTPAHGAHDPHRSRPAGVDRAGPERPAWLRARGRDARGWKGSGVRRHVRSEVTPRRRLAQRGLLGDHRPSEETHGEPRVPG